MPRLGRTSGDTEEQQHNSRESSLRQAALIAPQKWLFSSAFIWNPREKLRIKLSLWNIKDGWNTCHKIPLRTDNYCRRFYFQHKDLSPFLSRGQKKKMHIHFFSFGAFLLRFCRIWQLDKVDMSAAISFSFTLQIPSSFLKKKSLLSLIFAHFSKKCDVSLALLFCCHKSNWQFCQAWGPDQHTMFSVSSHTYQYHQQGMFTWIEDKILMTEVNRRKTLKTCFDTLWNQLAYFDWIHQTVGQAHKASSDAECPKSLPIYYHERNLCFSYRSVSFCCIFFTLPSCTSVPGTATSFSFPRSFIQWENQTSVWLYFISFLPLTLISDFIP